MGDQFCCEGKRGVGFELEKSFITLVIGSDAVLSHSQWALCIFDKENALG